MQCEERVEDYRFRHGGSRVVCSLGLIYSEASGLVLERSGADCSTDAGQVIRPEGRCQLAAQKSLLYYTTLCPDLVVKTPCGSRFKLDLVIRGTGTEIRNPVLKFVGEDKY